MIKCQQFRLMINFLPHLGTTISVSYLLTLQCPTDMTPSKSRTLKLQEIKYYIINTKLYWKDPLGFLLCCLTKSKTKGVIDEFHKGICGGHHAWRETTYKILSECYYYPKLFTDVNEGVIACNSCQLFAGKKKYSCLSFSSCQSWRSFPTMGPRFYQRNSSTIKCQT
jgi:hypothetical protein